MGSKLWRVAYHAYFPFWRVSCWLWVHHEVPGTRRLFHGPAMDMYAYLIAKAGICV